MNRPDITSSNDAGSGDQGAAISRPDTPPAPVEHVISEFPRGHALAGLPKMEVRGVVIGKGALDVHKAIARHRAIAPLRAVGWTVRSAVVTRMGGRRVADVVLVRAKGAESWVS